MDNTKIRQMFERLESLTALQLLSDENVRSSFIQLYLKTHPGESETDAGIFFEREALFFKRILLAAPALQEASRFSLYSCLIDVVTNGMTFDPAMKLMYIETRSVNTAPKNQPAVWESRASNKLTAEGELNLRMQLGQLKYADLPRLVYEGDLFKIGERDRKVYIEWESQPLPRKSKTIIASFVKLTRPDGSVDYAYLTQDDYERFRLASERQNKTKGANALYTSHFGGIDPGFCSTKTLRHAFKVLPKAKIAGTNTIVEDDDDTSEAGMHVDLGRQEDQPPPAGDASNGTAIPFTQTPPVITPQESTQEKVPGGVRLRSYNF